MIFNPILQTVKDKDNADDVEKLGPFPGKVNTWLGTGCYFWDRFEQIAHWWGRAHCDDKYMICQASAEIAENDLLDLVSSTFDMEYFTKTCIALEERLQGKHITISYVIQYLKSHNMFTYKAIRAHSINCGEGDTYFRRLFRDNQHNKAYLNLMPAIQFCFIDRSCIRNYHIIYPPQYVQVV